MKPLKVPTVGGLVGHISTVPVGRRGIVEAVNCMPWKKEGVLLWRPRVQLGTENEDWATIFNPDTESLLDMNCFYDKVGFLIKTSDHVELRTWKPGDTVETVNFNFPLPLDGETGQIEMVGRFVAVAIEGYGIYIVNNDEVFRIGSVWAGLKGNKRVAKQPSSNEELLLTITGSDKIFISSVTIHAFRNVYNTVENFEFKLRITDGDSNTYESLETYNQDIIPMGFSDTPEVGKIYAPVVFTFNAPMKPPLDIKLVKVSGTWQMDIEAASDEYIKYGYGVSYSGNTPHIHVNGTLDADGGIVGASRGRICGVKDDIFIEMAAVTNFEFLEEVGADFPIIKIVNSEQGMLVISNKAVYAVSGWSHGAVSTKKIAETGIDSHFDVARIDSGVIAYSWGRLTYYGIGGGLKMFELPFVYQLPENARVSFLPEWNLIVVGFLEEEYSLVYSLTENWIVWWRFDEIEKAVPLKVCTGVMCFSNGRAYLFSAQDNVSWNNYKVELTVNTGLIEEDIMLTVHKIRANAGVWVQNDGEASINIKACSRYGIQESSINVPVVESPSGYEGYGIFYQVPTNDSPYPRLAYIVNPPFVEVDTYVSGADSPVKGFFPTGNSFIIKMTLEEACLKHPGCLLEGFELYVEEVGSGL